MKTVEDIKNFIIRWNNTFPCDYWWRKKHNIAFMSPKHKECSFLDQLIEFKEDCLFRELEQRQKEIKEEKTYTPNIGEWLNTYKDFEGVASSEIQESDIDSFLDEVRLIDEKAAKLKNSSNG